MRTGDVGGTLIPAAYVEKKLKGSSSLDTKSAHTGSVRGFLFFLPGKAKRFRSQLPSEEAVAAQR